MFRNAVGFHPNGIGLERGAGSGNRLSADLDRRTRINHSLRRALLRFDSHIKQPTASRSSASPHAGTIFENYCFFAAPRHDFDARGVFRAPLSISKTGGLL